MGSLVIKPPTAPVFTRASIALFGSIEQGLAVDWQAKVQELLAPYEIDIFNPRRDHWDPSWVQSITNPKFREQVEWELTVLENVDVRLFVFDPNTKSPVTLAEFGAAAVGKGTLDTVVYCPEGYWRKGNVDIMCERYGVHQAKTLEDAVFECVSRLKHYYNVVIPENVTILPPVVPEPLLVDPLEE